MAHESTELSFRLFVTQQGDGQWYAHCVDLTVDGLAATRDEALQKVAHSIETYLGWAIETGQPLRRPSPWMFHARYRWYAIRDALLTLKARRPSPRRTLHYPQQRPQPV